MAFTFPTIDRPLRHFFKWYGNYLVEYWYLFVLLPLLLTVMTATGFIRFNELRDSDTLHMYTPDNALAWYEDKVLDDNWPLIHNRFLLGRSYNWKRYLFILVMSNCKEADFSEPCDLLDPNMLDEVARLNNYITNNISLTSSNGTKYYYNDLCLGWDNCYSAGGIIDMLKNKEFFEKKGIVISYPRANTDGTPVYVAFNLGGVQTHPDNGSILSVSAIRLVYFFRSETPEYDKLSVEFENAAEKFLNAYDSDVLNTSFTHSRSIDNGIAENAARLTPKFVITVAILLTMAALCMMKFERNPIRLNLILSKPFLAGAGILTAFMGILSGNGFFLLVGLKWPELAAVGPFLIISIGIDDMFIMVAAWDNTDPLLSVRKRMQNAMSEAAVAITITSLTDALSFAAGCVTSLPAVRGFCLIAAICILFNYLYQITFFAGLMVLSGSWEDQRRNAFVPCLKNKQIQPQSNNVELDQTVDKKPRTQTKQGQSQARKQVRSISIVSFHQQSLSSTLIRNILGPLLLKPVTKVIVLIIFLCYMGGAIWGCFNLVEGLQYDKLLLSDDPTVLYLAREKYYMKTGLQMEIIINKAPSMEFHENRQAIESICQHFENSEYGIGKEGTQFWLREYIKYQEWSKSQVKVVSCNDTEAEVETMEINENRTAEAEVEATTDYNGDYDYTDDDFSVPEAGKEAPKTCLNDTEQQRLIDNRALWIDGVYHWLERYSFHKLWSQDVIWKDAEHPNRSMPTFRFRIGLKEFHDSSDVRFGTKSLREISDLYYKYNVTTFQHYRQLADQMDIILPNTLQNVGIALLCMMIIALLFIPKPICTVFITLAIVSIDFGVVGYMTWWKVNLDPISMIIIIMSIGFSVDFSAHITYGYVSSPPYYSTQEKTVNALEKLAWPVFQGAISTILGVVALAFVDSYMVVVFFKTTFLIIIFGTIHALVFLPVLLSTCMPLVDKICTCSAEPIENNQV